MENTKRFKILLCLCLVGALGVYQFFPFQESYAIGLIHSIYFLLLLILYIALFCYELFLNKEAVKYEKKKFDTSSIYITSILFFTLVFFINIDCFEAKTLLKATYKNKTLHLKKNKTYKFITDSNYSTYFHKGTYELKQDTLRLFGNKKISNSFYIDTVFVKRNDSLIPVHRKIKFKIISPND